MNIRTRANGRDIESGSQNPKGKQTNGTLISKDEKEETVAARGETPGHIYLGKEETRN